MIEFYGIVASVTPKGNFVEIIITERHTGIQRRITLLSLLKKIRVDDIRYLGNMLKDSANEIVEVDVEVEIHYPNATPDDIATLQGYVGKQVYVHSRYEAN